MLTLRPVTPADAAFLFLVYASTRTEELASTDWDEQRKQAFLRMQFHAQSRHYALHYGGASFSVIEIDGAAVGRLYVDRPADEIRVVDIALLPQHRGHGIGTRLLRAILAEGADAGVPVTIHVEGFNPAMRLYLRLGFKEVADAGLYKLMEWRVPGGSAARPVGEEAIPAVQDEDRHGATWSAPMPL
jgi:GNAT superfamily N-acetyltransferase